MRIIPPALEIGELEGFTPEKDIFRRSHLGQGLTNLVSAVDAPLVLAVDGQWGSGKTVFLKMWAGELRKAQFPVVYFDAFEHDYVEDAFTAIAGEIISLAKLKKGDNAAAKKLIKSAVGAGKILLRSGLKLGVKAATLGVVDAADLEKVGADLAGEASALTDKHIGEMLTKQRQHEQTLQAFRNALTELPSLLNEAGTEAPKPLVFIIDEMDRCRPHFALQLLERIKHFFSADSVHFVLGVHLEQLRNSVRAVYGPGIDAQMYLQKFIHLTMHLVDEAEHQTERQITKYLDYLSKVLKFKPESLAVVGNTVQMLQFMADRKNLSLRTLERIMSALAVAVTQTPRNSFQPPEILAGLCILKITHPELFLKAKSGMLTYEEAADALGLPTAVSKDEQWPERGARLWWMYACLPEIDQETAQGMGPEIARYTIGSRTRIIPIVANNVVDRLRPPT